VRIPCLGFGGQVDRRAHNNPPIRLGRQQHISPQHDAIMQHASAAAAGLAAKTVAGASSALVAVNLVIYFMGYLQFVEKGS